jgi:hypothetical protein
LSIQVFAIGALAGNGQDLLIFLNTLLQFSEEDS